MSPTPFTRQVVEDSREAVEAAEAASDTSLGQLVAYAAIDAARHG